MITVFGKEWFAKYNKQLCYVANSFIGDLIFKISKMGHDKKKYGKITEMHPNAITHKQRLLYDFEKKETRQEYTTQFFTRNEYALRLQKVFYPIWLLFHAWDMLIANPFKPAWNLGFDTLTVYSTPGSTVSGQVFRYVPSSPEAFSTIRAGAGNGSAYAGGGNLVAKLWADTSTDDYQMLSRGIFLFDTSALTAEATISAATISLYGALKDTGLGASEVDVVSSTPASDTAVANGDYANLGSTVFASLASGSYTTEQYNDFSLNASGIANISKTGNSKFGIRINWDTDNSFGGSWGSNVISGYTFYDGGTAGTGKDPKLVVTYTTGPTHTLECATGSYTLTGQDIGLLRTYRILIETGNYALTGIDVGLSKAYKLVCETGSYILTGTDTTLKATYKLVCAVGNYTLTGIDVAISKAYKIACASGSYALTGIDTNLKVAYKIACASRSYALTRIATTITRIIPII